MGGKGASPQNNQMVQFEMQQAAEQRAKEERRKQRLDVGTKDINEMFWGVPIYENSVPAGVTGFTPGAAGAHGTDVYLDTPSSSEWVGGELLPVGDTGYKYRGASFKAARDLGVAPGGQMGGVTAPPDAYELFDPSGKYVNRTATWDELFSGTKKDTGKHTGQIDPVTGKPKPFFDDQFFEDYAQKQLDYNMPQVEDQFSKMTANTNAALARAGLLSSTAAHDAIADINKQNEDVRAGVINAADRAKGDLKTSVQSQYKQALSQLQAQEDPDVAATGALGSVNNMLQSLPQLTPLGDLFKPLVIGAGAGYNAYTDATNYGRGLSARPWGQSSGHVSEG